MNGGLWEVVVFYTALAVAVALLLYVGHVHGHFTAVNFDRRAQRREREDLMANFDRLQAAVAAAIAEIARLKGGAQDDAADQAKADELAGQLEGAVTPPPAG